MLLDNTNFSQLGIKNTSTEQYTYWKMKIHQYFKAMNSSVERKKTNKVGKNK